MGQEQPKVALLFLLTPQIQVKDFVLLALQKNHKELYRCPLLLKMIMIVVLSQVGEPEEKTKS